MNLWILFVYIAQTLAIPIPTASPKIIDFNLSSHTNYPNLSDLAHLKKRSYNRLLRRDISISDQYNYIYSGLDDQIIAYTIDIGLGQPFKYYSMLLDTGSSELWIANSTEITDNPYDYFNDNSKKMSGPVQHLIYGIGRVSLQWGTTTLTLFENTYMNDIPFSVAFQSSELQKFSHVSGLIGLAYTERNHTNLPKLLKDNGLIESTSYSLALNNKGSSCSILFGGVDHSKYTGQLVSVPRVDIAGPSVRYLAANLTAMSFVNNDTLIPINRPILLDSGTTYTYLPTEMYNSIISYLGVDEEMTKQHGEPMLDIEAYGDYEIEFEFEGVAKFVVKARDLAVPVSQFNLNEVAVDDDFIKTDASWKSARSVGSSSLSTNADTSPATKTFANSPTNPSTIPSATPTNAYLHAKYVPLGLSDTGSTKSSLMILGERALQAAYLVFDLDSDRIAIAQANEDGDSTNHYQEIRDGVIPGAVVV